MKKYGKIILQLNLIASNAILVQKVIVKIPFSLVSIVSSSIILQLPVMNKKIGNKHKNSFSMHSFKITTFPVS